MNIAGGGRRRKVMGNGGRNLSRKTGFLLGMDIGMGENQNPTEAMGSDPSELPTISEAEPQGRELSSPNMPQIEGAADGE